MNKKRAIYILVVLSTLIVTVALSSPSSKASVINPAGANDFYQRHPNWDGISLSNLDAASDYYQRHPELARSATEAADLSDYFLRHAGLVMGTKASDRSDYFQRHP